MRQPIPSSAIMVTQTSSKTPKGMTMTVFGNPLQVLIHVSPYN